MNAENFLYRSRRLVFALVIAVCLVSVVASQPMFSTGESDEQPNAGMEFPALADGSQPAMGGGG